MVGFNQENNSRPEGHFDLGELVIAPGASEAIPQDEIEAALARHLHLDFGEKSGDETLYNFTAIIENVAGCSRSRELQDYISDMHFWRDWSIFPPAGSVQDSESSESLRSIGKWESLLNSLKCHFFCPVKSFIKARIFERQFLGIAQLKFDIRVI